MLSLAPMMLESEDTAPSAAAALIGALVEPSITLSAVSAALSLMRSGLPQRALTADRATSAEAAPPSPEIPSKRLENVSAIRSFALSMCSVSQSQKVPEYLSGVHSHSFSSLHLAPLSLL